MISESTKTGNSKVLVTGATGQLGWDVVKELKRRGLDCRGTGSKELDITDREAVMRYIQDYQPDAVIHCAAYTAVDKAEDEPEKCRDVNVNGTTYIAEACRAVDAKMIYISTDYVFGDDRDQPHEVDDSVHPLNVYGQTKWEGEEAVRHILQKYFIVRISWVFGEHGNNFVKTMLRLGQTHKEISVVADQFGAPTYTADLAPLLCDMVQTEKYGTYHACNSGCCSWAELAEEIFRQAHMDVKVRHITTEEYSTKARRPKNSRLSTHALAAQGFATLPPWEDAVQRLLRHIIEMQDGGPEISASVGFNT